MNNETDIKNAVEAGQIPPLPTQDAAQENAPAEPVEQETAALEAEPLHEPENDPESAPPAGTDVQSETPVEAEPPAVTVGEAPQEPPQSNPRTIRRRQHYFTDLPGIGLEAEPLKAPWEENAAPDAEDDDDYPDGYKPGGTGKAAMAIAVTFASLLAVAVIGFLTYIIIANRDNIFSFGYDYTATADTAVETTVVTEPVTEPVTEIEVIMPDLIGMTESEAYRLLNEAQVRYHVTRVYSVDVPINCVVSQHPVADTTFSSGKEAIIYISKGKENEIYTTPTRPKTTQPATSATGTTSGSTEYLLPDSASRALTKSDLSRFDKTTLNLALNEIYARHGRKFSDPDINAYFLSKSWYQPTIAAKDFDDSILNQYESYNVKLITNYQSEMGYR